LFLRKQYEEAGQLDDEALAALKERTFDGLDTNDEVAIPYARTNMMMAGDSGANIVKTADSLIEQREDEYDYVLANIPYGAYAGHADMASFSYANLRRYEVLFLEKIVTFLKRGGSAAIIVPDSIVEATSYWKVRQKFLFDVRLDAVISLPPFVFEPYTTEKTYVLYFTKKMSHERGRVQDTPIWHCIIDFDGFQDGKKRYPINQDDFPTARAGFLSLSEEGKAGVVGAGRVNRDNFFSLCSEFYLRGPKMIEFPIHELEALIEDLEGLV
jgi:type I restriction-modification system DNA methylase subunit